MSAYQCADAIDKVFEWDSADGYIEQSDEDRKTEEERGQIRGDRSQARPVPGDVRRAIERKVTGVNTAVAAATNEAAFTQLRDAVRSEFLRGLRNQNFSQDA